MIGLGRGRGRASFKDLFRGCGRLIFIIGKLMETQDIT